MNRRLRFLAVITGTFVATLCPLRAESFWEPGLPDGQAFITLWRSIKSYRLSNYDIYRDGERYPVTELSIELTHGTAQFLFIESSRGKSTAPSVQEIAAGKFDENGDYSHHILGHPPDDSLSTGRPPTIGHPRFALHSRKDVADLYNDLALNFHVHFPW